MHVHTRDNAMRTELETQLLFCAPRELLLVGELSSRTRKLLDGYAAPASGVLSEAVDRYTAAQETACLNAALACWGLLLAH
jgi:hypothetical protein